MTLGDSNTEVYACAFNKDDKYLACGYGDGSVKIFNAADGSKAFQFDPQHVHESNVSSLKWRPVTTMAKTQNILASVHSDGVLKHWHVSSGKCLHKTQIGEEDNQLFTLDFSRDGEIIACAGKDHNVYLFDETEKVVSTKLESSQQYHTPHQNRVFAVKFNPFD